MESIDLTLSRYFQILTAEENEVHSCYIPINLVYYVRVLVRIVKFGGQTKFKKKLLNFQILRGALIIVVNLSH